MIDRPPKYLYDSHLSFEDKAFLLYKTQATHCAVYREFLSILGRPQPSSLEDIPCLPIQLFKTKQVVSSPAPYTVFQSSGTSGMERSKHFVPDISWYLQHSWEIACSYFTDMKDTILLFLLPSYHENSHSSLLTMLDGFMAKNHQTDSGFYLNNQADLASKIKEIGNSKRILLWGVTYALLDFCAEYSPDLSHHIVLETGGMKGRKKERIRSDIHEEIMRNTGCSKVLSEYGMSELLSQAYSLGEGIFQPNAWLRVLLSALDDPLSTSNKSTGQIKVIDLGNWSSCAFILTDDIGRVYDDNTFEVLGRKDFSETRGCNQLLWNS